MRGIEKPILNEAEREYLSEVKVQSQYLFLNKITWPDEIADLDYHLWSLGVAAIKISNHEGNPVTALKNFSQTFLDMRFQKAMIARIGYEYYGDGADPEINDLISLSPIKEAIIAYETEANKKTVGTSYALVQFEREFLDFAANPDKIKVFADREIPTKKE